MRECLRTLLILLLSVSVAACATQRVVTQGSQASITALQAHAERNPVNRRVVVVRTDDTRVDLWLTGAGPDGVDGLTPDQKERIHIPAAQVRSVELDTPDDGSVRKVVLVVLVVLVLWALAAGMAIKKQVAATVP